MTKVTLWGKVIPLWFVVVLAIPLTIGVALAAVSMHTTSYTNIGSEVVNVSEDLTPLCEGIDVENLGISVVGNDPGSPVAMTAGGAVANTSTTTGHYLYLETLTVHHTKANQIYAVELIKDGTSVGTLYVQQGASPTTSDHVHLTFDIGTSLQTWAYEIKVTEYS